MKSADLGAGPMTTTTDEAFVARLKPDGFARWSRPIGTRSNDPSVHTRGPRIAFTGSFTNTWTFDGETHRASGLNAVSAGDVMLANLPL